VLSHVFGFHVVREQEIHLLPRPLRTVTDGPNVVVPAAGGMHSSVLHEAGAAAELRGSDRIMAVADTCATACTVLCIRLFTSAYSIWVGGLGYTRSSYTAHGWHRRVGGFNDEWQIKFGCYSFVVHCLKVFVVVRRKFVHHSNRSIYCGISYYFSYIFSVSFVLFRT